MTEKRTCTTCRVVEDGEVCGRHEVARKMCGMHYQRWRVKGSPLRRSHKGTIKEQFWRQVDKAGPLPKWAPFLGACWLWTGRIAHDGYGTATIKNRTTKPHRFSYERLVGSIPEGLTIDHLCRVRNCVNPSHMEPVSTQENMRRAREHTGTGEYQTHCKRGHAYNDENTYVTTKGGRHCRVCKRLRRSKTHRVPTPGEL